MLVYGADKSVAAPAETITFTARIINDSIGVSGGRVIRDEHAAIVALKQ